MSVLPSAVKPVPSSPAKRAIALIVSLTLLVLGGLLITAGPAAAVGAPVLVDNFGGSHLGTRTVTPLPAPNTSTTPTATYSEGTGQLTTTMNGNGNGTGGLQLDYAMSNVDLTSHSNNNQFFLEFASIQRTPVQTLGETAATIFISLTDSHGVTGTFGTGVSNTGAFNIVLNFDCSVNPVCFSNNPDFSSVNHVQVTISYPTNHDSVGSTTAILNDIKTSPPGGAIPPAASPNVTTPTTSIIAKTGTTSADFTVAFMSNGVPAPVGEAPAGTPNLKASDFQVTGTAGGVGSVVVTGGPSTYDVKVGPLTTDGTVTVHVAAGVAVDGWGQANPPSGGDPTVDYVAAVTPVFSNATGTTFTAGTAGSFSFVTTGKPTPTFTETGALPAGVTLGTDGTLAGTASVGGTFPISVTAANVAGNATQSFTLTVNQAPVFTSATSAMITTGATGSFAVTTSAFPAATVTESGALPAGVTFIAGPNGTATIAGTPAAGTGASYPVTLTATNGVSPAGSQTFTLIVNQAPAITSGAAATFTVGSAATFTVTTTGFPAAAITEAGALPTGVTLVDNHNGTATLGGTPAAGMGGAYPLTITANNGIGTAATQTLVLTVQQTSAITSAATATAITGTAGSFTVTTTGSPNPSITETGALPSGVTLVDNHNGTATLGGTPAAGTGGSYALTLTANNGVGSASVQSFTFIVDQAAAITSGASTTFTTGMAGTFTVTTTGYPLAVISETGALPAGVTLTSNGDGTATLAGTPGASAGGTYNLTIKANNGVGTAPAQTFTLTIDQAPAITSAASTTFTTGAAGSFTVSTSGFPSPALTSTGTLLTGVSLVDNGNGTATLAGTPVAGTGGSYPLTITATNGVGAAASQSFALSVDQAPAITSASSTTFVTGAAGTFTVTTSGYPAAALTETGALPSGVTLTDNGHGTATLAGTPAASTGGTYALTISAGNGVGTAATQSFSLTVDQAPAITSAAAVTFTTAVAGTFTVSTSGFPTATVTEVGALPSGVTFADNGDGTATLAGTPAAATGGSYSLTFTADNGVGTSAEQDFTLSVAQAPAITSADSTTFTVGSASSFTVTTTGAPDAAITETGALPSGVTLTDNGDGTATLGGTPDAGMGGTGTFTITADNGVGIAASQTFTLTVDEAPAIDSAANTTFDVGTASTFTVTSTDGFPIGVALTITGTLPDGVSFTDNGDGTATLAGTPAPGTTGSYPLSIVATSPLPLSSSQSFTLTVAGPAHIPLPVTRPAGTGVLGGVPANTTPGEQLTVTGDGFAPFAPVEVGIYSSPTALASTFASATGTISVTVTIPATFSGAHTLVAAGADPSATARFLVASTTVTAPAVPSAGDTGSLAFTGPSVPLGGSLLFAALMLILGASLVLVGRRARG